MASPAFRLKTVGCIRTGCGKLPSGNSLGAFVVLKVRAEAAVSQYLALVALHLPVFWASCFKDF
jgi:hypothetical protein